MERRSPVRCAAELYRSPSATGRAFARVCTVKNICRFRLANLTVERFDVLICPNMHRFALELNAIVDSD